MEFNFTCTEWVSYIAVMTEDVYTVYGRPGCMYCYRAVELLQAKKLKFDYIDIYEQGLSKQDVSNRIGQPVHTMPQILDGDRYVGGCTELMSYLNAS